MSSITLAPSPGLRHALRGLRRRPGFAAAAALTLALGIGATTAIFSVVYGVLLKPLPYPDDHELVTVRHAATGIGREQLPTAPSMYLTYREESRTLEHVGLWGDGGASLTGVGEPEQVRALFVSDGVLQALGVQPQLGRWFSEEEHGPSAEAPGPVALSNAVILSHAFWQRRFGGDEAVLGSTLSLDSRASEVVGVMPPGFRFLAMTPQPDVIIAARIDRNRAGLDNFNFNAVARLKDDTAVAAASADLERMLPIWLDAWPDSTGGPSREGLVSWRIRPTVTPLKEDLVGGVAGMLWLVMGTVGAVLLIACANIANLLLVRADARRQELAIRTALGAGRWRIARELLTESIVLAAIGGVLGLAIAYGGLELLRVLGPANVPRLEDVSLDPLVLAFTIVVTLASGALLGSIPALKHGFASADPIVSGARGASASRERNRMRNALIVVQVALALVLLVGAGLMIRTFQQLSAVDPGFDPDDVQVARIWIPPSVIAEPERYTRVQRDILERIAALPGVTAAGFGFGVPMEGRAIPGAIHVEDRPYAADESPPTRRWKVISPGYLEALGTRVVAGRDLTWSDIDQGGKVALVSENLARELWGNPRAALGKRIREMAPDAPGLWREVVGVVQDVHEDALHRPAPPIVYWPVLRENFQGNAMAGMAAIAYAVRSERAGTENLVNEIRQAVWASNPDLPVFLVRTMQDLYGASMAQTSFTLVLLAIAGAMALCLGVVGIYGVIAYVVTQRSREIGIRLALGAQPPAVKRMFVLHGLGVAMIGVLAGLAGAVALSRWMTSLLFNVRPLDPATYIAVLAVLLGAVALSAYLPARRAARLDPADTLRAE